MKLINLFEHYVNVTTEPDKNKYIDTVWDILQLTYKPIGGFLSAASKEELIEDSGLWKLVRKNGKIVACAIYKDKNGRKSIAKGSDGTSIGKLAVKQIYIEDVKMNRAWGEFSGKAEELMLKNGGIPIPNNMAADILHKTIVSLNPDGFHYTRIIAGEPHEKILIGKVEK